MSIPALHSSVSTLPLSPALQKITLVDGKGTLQGIIESIEGKKNSFAIYAHLLNGENGTITKIMAEKGLALFGDFVTEAKANPGKHPNIDILLAILSGTKIKAALTYEIDPTLQDAIAHFTSCKKNGTLLEEKAEALKAFTTLCDLLEKGHIRTAEFTEGGWKVNAWVKEGLLLGFPLGNIKVFKGSADIQFADKETFPLRTITADLGFRVVPPAAGLRRGAYAGQGTIFMPPAYVNMGAFIGQNTMVENLAGSCCQVGRNCHISAGAIIAGVLDPIEATPVILGDNVLLGEGTGVSQGTRLGDLVTLAPGVHISKATPVIDVVNKVAYTAKGIAEVEEVKVGEITLYRVGKVQQEKDGSYGPEIPDGALIIPGTSVSSLGTLKATPTIVKYISSPEERAYALEDALRN